MATPDAPGPARPPWLEMLRDRDRRRHLYDGGRFGLLIAGVAFLGLWASLGLWSWLTGSPATWPWPFAPLVEGLSAAEAASAQLGFVQGYAAFVGIFLASALGYFAFAEFVERQERPDLHLSFHVEPYDNRVAVRRIVASVPVDEEVTAFTCRC